MQPKTNTKRQTQVPTALYELFLLTVPIEEVARRQYETVLIIFPLNRQTITIAFDVVKWRGEGFLTFVHAITQPELPDKFADTTVALLSH